MWKFLKQTGIEWIHANQNTATCVWKQSDTFSALKATSRPDWYHDQVNDDLTNKPSVVD